MFQRNFFLLIMLLGSIFIAGCGQDVTTSQADMQTITDLAGNQVEVPKQVQRIAVIPVPWASVIFGVDGSGDKIVAMHPLAMTSYKSSILSKLAPKLASADTSAIDNNFTVNIEELMKDKPDVVLLWDYQTENDAKQKLAALGVPSLMIHYGTLEDVQHGIQMLGTLLGKEDRAQELLQWQKDIMAHVDQKQSVLANAPKPKVLYLQNESLSVAAADSVNRKMIAKAGGVCVSQDVPGQWKKVTMEQIAAWNPDIIIISNFTQMQPEAILQNKLAGQDWSQIAAVKNHRVYKAPQGLYRWDAPCIETPLMMEWLGKVIQPKIFADVDLRADIHDFYQNLLHYDLTPADTDEILHSAVNAGLKL